MTEAYNPEVVRELIAKAVARPGWSQARLARELHVRPQTVNKWISGENTPPVQRWAAIETALDLEPGALFRAGGMLAGSVETVIITEGSADHVVLEALAGAERLTPERRAQLVGYLERLLEEQATEGTK